MRRIILLPLLCAPALAAPPETEAERSGFARTGRYEEVERLCAATAAAEPRRVRCLTFGRTPEGRPMLALVASADGVLEPAEVRRRGRPVILVQGGIHAGEIDGKDAIFWSLRELLAGKMAPGSLGAVTAVFVPVFNVDGHERFGKNHRPHQRGPEEMGFRATAQNLNLNRDYLKADAPEMHAMLALLEEWDPVVTVDLHATNGAKFEHGIAVLVAPSTPPGDRALDRAAARLSRQIQTRLRAAGHLPLPFYPSFRNDDDPTSGFAIEDAPPRFSTSYLAARNRIGVLVETHSWKPYRERVTSTRDTIAAIFERALRDAPSWRAAARDADERSRRLGGTDVALTFVSDGTSRPIDFRGYAYRVVASEISGKPWIIYDETRPQVWRVPLFERLRPALTVRAPAAGYLVPPAHAAAVAAKLRLHGIRFETLTATVANVAARGYRVEEMAYERPFEGRQRVAVTGAWQPVEQELRAGSLFVPIDQPRARLVLHLLEPEAPDSLVAWGHFSAALTRVEYMEDYVLEEEARKMLAATPGLKEELERQLREDPELAASPEARLRFFYRRHPAWDARHEWVPVLKLDVKPAR